MFVTPAVLETGRDDISRDLTQSAGCWLKPALPPQL
jgi:hypothetical protein